MSDHNNAVSHPSHYASGGIECKDAMAAMMGNGYCLQPCATKDGAAKNLPPIGFYWWACAFKYLWRWDKKNGIQDLEKCKQCIDFLIAETGEKTSGFADDEEKTCTNLSEFQNCDSFICSHCGWAFQTARLFYDVDSFCGLDEAIKAQDYETADCDVCYCPNCGYRIVEGQ